MDKSNLKKEYNKNLIRVIAGAVLIIAALLFFSMWISNTSRTEKLKLLTQSVKRTVVECYAIEGEYPASVEYMVTNYGLKYDETKYYIHYDYLAGNMMPTIEVYEKR